MNAPTCQELFREILPEVYQHDDTSWRHGFYRETVYHRECDGTYWSAHYRVSTDGETNELRTGEATIIQVVPKEVLTVTYEAIK